MQTKTHTHWQRLIGGIGLAVLLLVDTTGWAATGYDAGMVVAKPSTFGRYNETVEDMRVKVLGGHLRVTREWAGKDWQINRRWVSVGYQWESTTQCSSAYTDNTGKYHPASCSSGNFFTGFKRDNIKYGQLKKTETNADGSTTAYWYSSVEPGKYFIVTTDPTAPPPTIGGIRGVPAIATLRWQDVQGEWIEYEPSGNAALPFRPIRFGNSNNVTVTLIYNADGKLTGLSDHLNKQILWYEYNAINKISLIKDYSGRQVEYRYDAKNKLAEVTDVRGYIWKYGYDTNGFLASKTDPNNNATTMTYTVGGVLKDSTDPLGNKTVYLTEYDKTKKEYYKRETTPGGKVTELWYDDNGEFLRKTINSAPVRKIERNGLERIETGEDGNKTIRIVNSDELTTKTTWPDGSFTTTEYAPGTSYPTKEVDELGTITLNEYDAQWNLKKRTEAAGKPEQRVTTYTYDSYGNRLSTTIEADAVSAKVTTSATYDEYGNAKTKTDGVGNVTSYTHDAMGNVLTETKVGNRTWTYSYDNAGNPLTRTDPLDHVTTLEYDKVGNKIKETDAMNHVTQFQYDAMNRMSKVVNALNQVATLDYDADGYLTKATNFSGMVKKTQYDVRGWLIKQIDAAGNVIKRTYVPSGNGAGKVGNVQYPTYSESYNYDNRGNLIEKTARLSASEIQNESYHYDVAGNKISSADAKGRATQLSYDALGRLAQTTSPTDGITKYSYDNRDNLLSVTNARNIMIRRYTYDGNNRKTSEVWPDGRKVQYRYDDVANIAARISGNGQVTRYLRGVSGYIEHTEYFAKEADASPEVMVTYIRNALGQPTSITDGTITLIRTYNALGQQESEMTDYGNFSLGYQYGFDAAGRKTSLMYPDGKKVNYIYDEAGQLTSITLPGTGTLAWNHYQWNVPTSMTLPGGSSMRWAYDALMRPSVIAGKDAGDNPLLNYTYSYDAVGNITEKQTEHGDYLYSYDELDRLVSVTNPTLDNETYTYDVVGNRLTDSKATGDWVYGDDDSLTSRPGVTYKYDANGSMTEQDDNGTITRYVYDVTGRMTEVRDGNDNLIASYAYDPFGRRIKKTANGVTTYFLYSEEGLIAEADSAGSILRQYGWKPNGTWGTDPLYMMEGGNTYYYQNDHLGAPQKLISISGAVVWSASYESFGWAHINSSTVTNLLRFPGQYHDMEVDRHYNYFRNYAPAIGRYTKIDPIGIIAGVNSYIYGNNNPLRFIDPHGLDTVGCDGVPDFLETPCRLECCAKHDECFDKHGCGANSWYYDCVFPPCKKCDVDASDCMNGCGFSNKDDPNKENYYCAKQHRYVKIPGDFPDYETAKKSCSST